MKKTRLLFLFTMIFISVISYAQNKKYQNGILILNDNDSIHCSIKAYEDNVLVYTDKLKIRIDGKEQKIESLKVRDVVLGEILYTKYSFDRKKQIKKGPRKVWVDYKEIFFARRTVEGTRDLYKRYSIQSNGSSSTGYYNTIVWKHYLLIDSELKLISNIKNDLPMYYKDCPKLTDKIESKKFRQNSMEEIIKIANELCDSLD